MKDKETEIWGKPLDRMTTTDLKEAAKAIPDIAGVHGMKKDELIAALRSFKGIEVAAAKTATASLRSLKKKISSIKVQRADALAAQDRKKAAVARRRIARLKKKTRKAAV